jgi:hypothetical protein
MWEAKKYKETKLFNIKAHKLKVESNELFFNQTLKQMR